MSDLGLRAVSVLGWIAWVALAWALSVDRRRMPWRTVAWGLGLQAILGLVLLKTGVGTAFFSAARTGGRHPAPPWPLRCGLGRAAARASQSTSTEGGWRKRSAGPPMRKEV